MTTNEGVIGPDARDFTVQIRHADGETIEGTGFIATDDGRIVTCAHVVEAVIEKHPREALGESIHVYFPRADRDADKRRTATITGCFPGHDDDVVLLKLDGPLPGGKTRAAKVGRADASRGHPFNSYGFPKMDDYPASRADGTIMGSVDPPEGRKVQADPIELKSQHIAPGMSGAPVLDMTYNLVVDVISETWFPDASTKHRDTGWAVNARVLSLDPLGLPMHGPQPSESGAEPPETELTAAPNPGIEMHGAPPPLDEWVGREDLLSGLDKDWANDETRITGLVGFGGEGKSSIARRWADQQERADGLFWWSFYDERNPERFVETLFTYMVGEEAARRVLSTSVRVDIIGAMLDERRYLLVLDGFEVMQEQAGDRFGEINSRDLLKLLEYAASPEHDSFCLVTTRTPLMDLERYTTYKHRAVERLSTADGRALLRQLRVKGDNVALDRLVEDWDGHALTISLIGGYLADKFGGDVAHADDIPRPTADEGRYERVHRVLRRHDEYLGEPEKAFLTLFAAFRAPVHRSALRRVFRTATGGTGLNAPLVDMSDDAFDAMLNRLRGYRILRYNETTESHTIHPLIRAHYLQRLSNTSHAVQEEAHNAIKNHYLELTREMPDDPTLEELVPVIEAIHHACQAGSYDEGDEIREKYLYQGNRKYIIRILGAYDTDLSVMRAFFPEDDLNAEPGVSHDKVKGFILNGIGLCLMNLGRLAEAMPFYERGSQNAINRGDWQNASIGYQNVAILNVFLGRLTESDAAARYALQLARRLPEGYRHRQGCECDSLARLGWVLHLQGQMAQAIVAFAAAETLEKAVDSVEYLYSARGIQYAEHLWRAGQVDMAWLVMQANLRISQEGNIVSDISQCYRMLGDLAADAGQHEEAEDHYRHALESARSVTYHTALIEALLSIGCWQARYLRDAVSAHGPLTEALGYAVDGGYRIYEADIRVALGWMHLAAGESDKARAEAGRARAMSEEMGYHWGVVDADEVLAVLP